MLKNLGVMLHNITKKQIAMKKIDISGWGLTKEKIKHLFTFLKSAKEVDPVFSLSHEYKSEFKRPDFDLRLTAYLQDNGNIIININSITCNIGSIEGRYYLNQEGELHQGKEELYEEPIKLEYLSKLCRHCQAVHKFIYDCCNGKEEIFQQAKKDSDTFYKFVEDLKEFKTK